MTDYISLQLAISALRAIADKARIAIESDDADKRELILTTIESYARKSADNAEEWQENER